MTQLLTTAEAAAALRVSRNRVKSLLPAVRLSAHGTRYDSKDVARLVESLKTPPAKRAT
jgi:hypothetical protein